MPHKDEVPHTETGMAILAAGQQSEAKMTPQQWQDWWRTRIVAIEQETFAQATLVGEEREAMEHLFACSDLILGWGLRANTNELTQAIHVIQGFIVQHMLFRLNPVAWSLWYSSQEVPPAVQNIP